MFTQLDWAVYLVVAEKVQIYYKVEKLLTLHVSFT